MSHYGEFMDGVPVRISERYKRPPCPQLPSAVERALRRARTAVENADGGGTFGGTALDRVRELRSAKRARRQRRQLRLEARQEALQRAKESEDLERTLQQLSVTGVRYPSEEDVSCVVEVPHVLQPTLVPEPTAHCHPFDDPDPLDSLRPPSHRFRVPQYSDINKLSYSDFEYDNSSPFDNVELKTINDMELLAEVLRPAVESNGPSHASCSAQAPVLCPLPPLRPSCSVETIVKQLANELGEECGRRVRSGLSADTVPVCERVVGMGFQLERVVRVCRMVGADEKKVIDVLLLLEELLVLGFGEQQVCDALLLCNYDRDKALDHLIT